MTLESLLRPRSIAILGASEDLTKINGRALKFLVEKNYSGALYPINPKYERIAGLRCYPNVASLPRRIDLAIVALPAKYVAGSIRELTEQGCAAAVVFSSGFAELGEQGRVLEREVREIARGGGLRLCGPNCLGLINAFDKVMATFGQYADGPTPAGPVGFVTQSGAFGTAIAALARRRGLGLGYFVNTGNEADISFSEVMRDVLADERIRVGAGYIEGLKDGELFTVISQNALEQGKPLIVTKVGRTTSGARAAASHTGSLAGEDVVFNAITSQYGVIRARNEEHMLDLVEAFTYCQLPSGNGLGIITQSGGAGVLMADRAEELGITVPLLNAQTQSALRAIVPEFGALGNPVDVTGQFVAEPALLEESIGLTLADPAVHIAIVWLQLMDAHVDTLVGIFKRAKQTTTKPFLVCWVAAPERAVHELHALGIAVLRGAEPAVDAVGGLTWYSERRGRIRPNRRSPAVSSTAIRLLPKTNGIMGAGEAAQLLASAGITLSPARVAADPDEAAVAAAALGFPVAVKIESRDIAHKSDIGGVKLGLTESEAVRSAARVVLDAARRHCPNARIDGVLVQHMVDPGIELVVGLKNDAVFGPVVMAGLGGVFVEVLNDVVFRKAPIGAAEANAMLAELRARSLLEGARGQPPVAKGALGEFISAVSRFGASLGPRLESLDLNPVIANSSGCIAVDWLLTLR